MKQESFAGTPVYGVESLPKTPEIAADSRYSKRVSWIAKDSLVSVKVEFHDMAGTLLKTLENSNVTLVAARQNKFQPMQVQVKNHHVTPQGALPANLVKAPQPSGTEWAVKLDRAGQGLDWSVSYFVGYERFARYRLDLGIPKASVFQGDFER